MAKGNQPRGDRSDEKAAEKRFGDHPVERLRKLLGHSIEVSIERVCESASAEIERLRGTTQRKANS